MQREKGIVDCAPTVDSELVIRAESGPLDLVEALRKIMIPLDFVPKSRLPPVTTFTDALDQLVHGAAPLSWNLRDIGCKSDCRLPIRYRELGREIDMLLRDTHYLVQKPHGARRVNEQCCLLAARRDALMIDIQLLMDSKGKDKVYTEQVFTNE